MTRECKERTCNNIVPSFDAKRLREFCSHQCFLKYRGRWLWMTSEQERDLSKDKVWNYRELPDQSDDPEFDWSVEQDSAYFAYLRSNAIAGNQPVTESCWRRTIYER